MSRDADILFCKIAITAGMISHPQAQKVLAFLDKKEQETGRRPLAAAVFTKHQLMTTAQVQKVKAAVAKRRGEAMPVPGVVPSRRSRGERRRARRERTPRRPVDQQTLVMGAGFGVVFVGVLITICYLFLVGGGSKVSSSGSSQTVAEEQSPGSGVGNPASEDRPSPVPVPVDRELPREVVNEIHNMLSDIQRDLIDKPTRAQLSLRKLKTDLEKKRNEGYTIPADIEARLSDVEEGVKAIEAMQVETEEPPLPEETAPPPEKETPPPEKEEPATPDEDEDDLDLNDLDDLDDF